MKPAGFYTSVQLKSSKRAICFQADSTFIFCSRDVRWPCDCAHSAGKYKLFSSDTIPSLALSWPVLVFAPAVQARAWRAVLLPLCPMLSLSTLCHILSGTLLCTLHSFGPGWGTSICQIVIVYQELIWCPFVLSFRVSFPRSQSPVHLLPGTETHCSALAEVGSSASLFFHLKTELFLCFIFVQRAILRCL